MSRTVTLLAALGAVLALGAALAGAAQARTVTVPSVLGSLVGKAQAGGVAVLLPTTMRLDVAKRQRLFTRVDAQEGEYELQIAGARDCDANACFLASLQAERGEGLGGRANVTLAHGIKGRYTGLSCGASCSPPSIAWVLDGVRYEIQAKALGGRAAFVRMAGSAIRNGART